MRRYLFVLLLLTLGGLASAQQPDRKLFDFESGTWAGWTYQGSVEKSTFGKAPLNASKEVPTWRTDRDFTGWQGDYILAVGDTRHETVSPGKMLSDEFEITHHYLKFRYGGEVHPNVKVCLIVDGREMRTTWGNNSYDMRLRGWDVSDLRGRRARILIQDTAKVGSLMRVDDFVLSDTPPPALGIFDLSEQESDIFRYGELRPILTPAEGYFFSYASIVRGPEGRWHLYAAECTIKDRFTPGNQKRIVHATADKLPGPWKKEGPALEADAKFGEAFLWEPFVLVHDGMFYMYYVGSGKPWSGWDKDDKNNRRWMTKQWGKASQGPFGIHLATSKDGAHWERHGAAPLFTDDPFAFTPCVMRHGDEWVMYYGGADPANGRGKHAVIARTSKDLVHWENRRTVLLDLTDLSPWPELCYYRDAFVFQRGGDFFLMAGSINNDNQSRFHYRHIYRSSDPFHFDIRTEYKGLFLEGGGKVIEDEGGKRYITHSGLYAGGVWLAPFNEREGLGTRYAVHNIDKALLLSKIKGGWAGQMIGVSVAAPTEFRARQVLYENKLRWDQPREITNSLHQDDLYVEMTFAEVMDKLGLDAKMADYGKAFGQSKYNLWHANKAGRDNIRAGVMPPQSGDPAHNAHWRDIDFQIEADFIGLMCPGLPQASNAYCEKIGHVMNYGDGVYGGMFIAAMYAAAFHEDNPEKIIRAGIAVLPPESDTAKAMTDLLRVYKQNPTDWKKTWAGFNKLWDEHGEPCPDGNGRAYNIDAFLNAGYVAIGLLYGEGDFSKTVSIATRCGQDSDCNGATAGGIIGTVLGYDRLPQDWLAELQKIKDSQFSYTNFSFDSITSSTYVRALENIKRAGGITLNNSLIFPVQAPKPATMEVWQGEFKKETPEPEKFKMSEEDFADRIKGGWAGQMIGVTVGGPTEFKAKMQIYDKPLAWDHPELVKDCLNQDDLYVDMTFAEVMDRKGIDATPNDYAKAFGESQYKLWHANKAARDNIKAGIMPPASGDPAHNAHWRDIDFQIEADFIGLMCPGQLQASNQFCDRIGHIMNYGDGVYGGMFIAALYASAFMEHAPEAIVRNAMKVLPRESYTYQSIADVLRLRQQYPTDWKKAWAEYNKRWNEKDEPCPKGHNAPYNIDAFLNASYVAIGLLYGEGDLKKSVEIAIGCGEDSDCNGATAAGVIGTMIGYGKLPQAWRAEIEKIQDRKFNYTDYSFKTVCDSTIKRALEVIKRNKGEVGGGTVKFFRQEANPARFEVWNVR